MYLLLSILIASSPSLAADEPSTDAVGRAMNEHLAGIERIDAHIAVADDEAERRQLQDQRRTALRHAREAIAAQRVDDVDSWLALLERFEVPPASAGDPVTLAGTITAAATGLPLAGIPVSLQGPDWVDLVTDANGQWSHTGPAGSWRIGVETNPAIWVARAWPDVSCTATSACTGWGEFLELASGEVVDDLDFALVAPGYITGLVRDGESAPLAGASVRIFPDGNYPATSATTGVDGSYSLRVAPGNVRLIAEGFGHRTEVWPDAPCTPTCAPEDGSVIAVGDGQTVSGIDFELLEFGSMRVTVTRQSDQAPVPMAFVWAGRVGGGGSASGWTDSDGAVHMPSLPDGDYHVTAFFPTLQPIAHPALPCLSSCGPLFSCDPAGSTPVAVSATVQTEVAMIMPSLARVSGVTRKQANGLPAPDAFVSVRRIEPVTCNEGGATSAIDGTWEVEVPAGTYAAKAGGSNGYLEEIYPGVDCSGPTCDWNDGHPINVGLAAHVPGIDFTLQDDASISGTVTELASGLPPVHHGDLAVALVKSDESESKLTTVQPDGSWSRSGLSPGSWYARISWYGFGETHNYRYMVWPDAQCPLDGTACPSSLGTAIPVAEGEEISNVNFEVERLGRIGGLVTLADPTLPISTAEIAIRVDGPNGYFAEPRVYIGETWNAQRMAPGTYYVRAASSYLLRGELWENIPCPLPPQVCPTSGGTPIVIGTDPDPFAAPMALDAAPGIRGALTEFATGLPPVIFATEVRFRSVATGAVEYLTPNEEGQFFMPLAPGDWQVWVNGWPDLQSQAWPGIPCDEDPSDCWSLATPVTVTTAPAGTTTNFTLYPPDGLFQDGFESGGLGRWSTSAP
jgi:hypothetical protein